jgi:pimeloyl-ACP methyl ester carboxylesterase
MNRSGTEPEFRPVEIDGVRGWYAEAGAGPPVVLLASPLARAKTYRPTVGRLAAAHRVFAVEMPGSGRADRLPRPWSLAGYAAWAAGFLTALDLSDATVIGHSHSGAVTVVLAAEHPGRVGRIVVCDSIGAGGPHPLLRAVAAGVIDVMLEFPLVVRAWHHVAGNAVRHPWNFAHQVWASFTEDVTALASRVKVPALVAWGRRDHTLPPRCAAAYARSLPDAAVYLSGGSHDWIISRADEFAGVVGRFVRGEPVSPPVGRAPPGPCGPGRPG